MIMFDLKRIEKHKKTIGIVCLAVFIGSFVVRYAYRRITDGRRPPSATAKHTLTPDEVKAMGFANMAGIWNAQGYLKGTGTCRLHLELRQAQGLFRGDTQFACLNLDDAKNLDPIKLMTERNDFLADPDTSILAGKVEN